MVGLFASLLLKSAVTLVIGTAGSFGLQAEDNQTFLIDTSNSFGLRIYKEYLGGNPASGNVIFSPYSLASAMYMLMEGTSGKTYKEIKFALGPDARRPMTIQIIDKGMKNLSKQLPLNSSGYTLNVANSVWVKKGFALKLNFTKKLTDVFSANASDVDFGADATDRINEWCDNATNHHIPQLFTSPLDPSTVMVLVNAIYFKGVWKTQFDPRNTYDRRFYANKDVQWQDVPKVQTMSVISDFALSYNPELKFQLLALPYENDEVTMYILLPDQEVTLEQIERQLTYQILQNAIDNSTEVKVDVALPKFKLNNELSLIPALNRVGIKQVFSDSANLSRINQNAPLKVSKVIQKAVVEVNEQGTVAAAVSGISIMARSMQNHYDQFHADRPFMFFIQHAQSRLILFEGRVTNP